MFDARQLSDRYERDNAFNTLVKCMEAHIYQNGYDPMELREAAFFACYKYQMRTPLYTLIAKEGEMPMHLRNNDKDEHDSDNERDY